MKRPVHVRTRRAFSTTKRPEPRRRDLLPAAALLVARRLLSRPRRDGSARREPRARAPRRRDAIALALAPWVFRSGAGGRARRRARDGGRRAWGRRRRRTRAPARQRRRRRRGARRRRRALWDALFAPIAHASRSKTRQLREPYRARSNVPRSNVASELILELGRLGLYSQTAAGGGPAPPNGEAPRDRLEAFAASVFVRGGTNGASAPPDASAKALRALVATDLRLVEPHLSDAFAATWSAETLTDAASETVAAAVGAYAATRRIPECLAAVGAAAALLSASDAPASDKKGIECARVFATPAVLAAAAAARARACRPARSPPWSRRRGRRLGGVRRARGFLEPVRGERLGLEKSEVIVVANRRRRRARRGDVRVRRDDRLFPARGSRRGARGRRARRPGGVRARSCGSGTRRERRDGGVRRSRRRAPLRRRGEETREGNERKETETRRLE